MREVDCEEFNIAMLVSIETLVVVHCPYYVNYVNYSCGVTVNTLCGHIPVKLMVVTVIYSYTVSY